MYGYELENGLEVSIKWETNGSGNQVLTAQLFRAGELIKELFWEIVQDTDTACSVIEEEMIAQLTQGIDLEP